MLCCPLLQAKSRSTGTVELGHLPLEKKEPKPLNPAIFTSGARGLDNLKPNFTTEGRGFAGERKPWNAPARIRDHRGSEAHKQVRLYRPNIIHSHAVLVAVVDETRRLP